MTYTPTPVCARGHPKPPAMRTCPTCARRSKAKRKRKPQTYQSHCRTKADAAAPWRGMYRENYRAFCRLKREAAQRARAANATTTPETDHGQTHNTERSDP